MSGASAERPVVRRWSSTNRWVGRPYGPPIAFVLHTSSGGESGTVAEYLTSASELSCHYSVGLDGSIDAFIDAGDRAWSNGILEPGTSWPLVAEACGVDPAINPNHVTVTCDTADGGQLDREVTEAQFAGVLFAAREAQARYPRSIRYLLRHADISPQSRAHCPGERWMTNGRFCQLARALQLRTTF